MTSINILGTYSGISIDTVDQLIEAESAKGIKYTNQKAKIERERSAWKDVNTRLDNLSKKLDVLTKGSTFESRTVSSSVNASDALGVTANRDAATGTYRIVVDQLATSSQLTGGQVEVDSIYADLFTFTDTEGSFTINYPTSGETSEGGQLTINLEKGETYSLKDIENLINEKTDKTGIQASIIDRRLVLTDTVQGNRTISVSSDSENTGLIDRLGLHKNKTEHTDGQQFKIGQQAKFKINGVEITSDSNRVNDVVEGLTFDLKNVHENTHGEVITVSHDSAKATDAVREFVEQYNSTINFITTQLDVGDPSAENNTTGALTGDGTLMRLQSTLRSILTGTVTEKGVTGKIRSTKDLGIEIDRYGVASFDEAKFNEVLQEDPTNVARFFYRQDSVEIPVEDRVEGEPTTKTQRDGVSELLKNFIDTYISSRDGVITNKNESYDRMLKDITTQIDTFNDRIARKRDRYIQQFTALDIAMMQAESQLDYMYSQIGIDNGKNK